MGDSGSPAVGLDAVGQAGAEGGGHLPCCARGSPGTEGEAPALLASSDDLVWGQQSSSEGRPAMS